MNVKCYVQVVREPGHWRSPLSAIHVRARESKKIPFSKLRQYVTLVRDMVFCVITPVLLATAMDFKPLLKLIE